VGLLALSGGLIASCAIAGSTTAFSVYAPSGGVRAFALTRIPARYGERLSAHAISLEWLIRLRRKLFVDLAALPVAAQRRFASGEVLDRAMADGDAVVEALPGPACCCSTNRPRVSTHPPHNKCLAYTRRAVPRHRDRRDTRPPTARRTRVLSERLALITRANRRLG
jgi:hypothetical protein